MVSTGPTLDRLTPSAVRLAGIRKSYGAVEAVSGIDLEVRTGEFLTLLGPSGSGKTTTLMMIAGFERPSVGQVYINGVDCTGLPAHRRNLSMVFQNYALFPHRTVARNVAFPLEMRRRTRAQIEQGVAEALAAVRLTGFEDRLPTQLSGGQQQRVALARAIGFGPSILLMDEPLGALDKNLREQVQLEIKDLQRRLGVSVIYVTHDQHEALTMSDRIVVMNQGRIEQVDTPETIYQTPKSRFVAGFLGAANFIEAEVIENRPPAMSRVRVGDDLLLTAENPAGVAVGKPITFAIRPERIEMLPAKGSDPRLETFAAKITQAIFMGDSTFYIAEASRLRLQVKVANGGRAYRPAAGDEVALGWAPGDLVVLAD